jgi:GTP-binding protein
MEWLGENLIPFAIVFTKADKLKPQALERQVQDYIKHLLTGVWEEAPQYFISSASKQMGKEEILSYIENINRQYYSHQGS